MRQSGSALRKLIRSVAEAGLWSGGVGKDQVQYASRESQSGTGGKAVWDGPLIGPGKRILSDNGSAYRSKPWREACAALGLTPKRTRPYTPRTNGKTERFIKTLLAEWAYSMAFQTSTERNHWLPRYLAIYNSGRCNMALAGRTPIQQFGLLRATA